MTPLADRPPTPLSNDPTSVQLTVNGVPRQIRGGASVADLLSELGVRSDGIAVERNRDIVRRAEHASCLLQSGDVIEVVHFVGGG